MAVQRSRWDLLLQDIPLEVWLPRAVTQMVTGLYGRMIEAGKLEGRSDDWPFKRSVAIRLLAAQLNSLACTSLLDRRGPDKVPMPEEEPEAYEQLYAEMMTEILKMAREGAGLEDCKRRSSSPKPDAAMAPHRSIKRH